MVEIGKRLETSFSSSNTASSGGSPAVSLSHNLKPIGGWLPSLIFALGHMMRFIAALTLAVLFVCLVGCASLRPATPMPLERRAVALSDSPIVTVVCELRYYLVGHVTSLSPTNRLQVVRNDGTNLICTISEPLSLLRRADTNLVWEIGGFVLQIVAPAEYAGQILTAHFDGIPASGDPFRAFAFDRRYQMDVSRKFIGGTNFGLCY